MIQVKISVDANGFPLVTSSQSATAGPNHVVEVDAENDWETDIDQKPDDVVS